MQLFSLAKQQFWQNIGFLEKQSEHDLKILTYFFANAPRMFRESYPWFRKVKWLAHSGQALTKLSAASRLCIHYTCQIFQEFTIFTANNAVRDEADSETATRSWNTCQLLIAVKQFWLTPRGSSWGCEVTDDLDFCSPPDTFLTNVKPVGSITHYSGVRCIHICNFPKCVSM